MSRIARLTMRNIGCYAGDHVLDLDDRAYAVIARHKENPERSNWLGKSSLFAAIRLIIFGDHGYRTEDEWITNDEKEGYGRIDFDDGGFCERSRIRTKSTKFSAGAAKGDEAQAEIVRKLGVDSKDFIATCYFEQRAMARFILQAPKDRVAVVGAWLNLAPLIQAEEIHRVKAASLAWELETTANVLSTARTTEQTALAGYDTLDKLLAAVKVAESDHAAAHRSVGEVNALIQENEKCIASMSRQAEYDAIVERGKELRAQVDAGDSDKLRERVSTLRANEIEASSEVSRLKRYFESKRIVARGEFDGKCPVADIECPATKQINSRRAASAKERDTASVDLDEAAKKHALIEEERETADAEYQAHERARERLESLREQARSMRPDTDSAVKTPIDRAELRGRLDTVTTRSGNAIAKVRALQQSLTLAKAAADQIVSATTKVRDLESQLATEREAMIVFGKNGAQRSVAESALNEIGDDANGMLAECGIDLTVTPQWSREGDGLATTCNECGHPFPKSERIKVCERCGVARGPNLINKLEIAMSNRSGAADDLGGIAFQLAAAAWLRRKRNVRWSCALIDEPFGQLDAAIRRSLSLHLAGLLSGRYGFSQALVIAHDTGTLGAFPGRIEILSDGKRASVKVVA